MRRGVKIVVGLSILSLNQLAEHVAQAEALSAEVAIILKGFQAIGALRVDAERPSPKGGGECRTRRNGALLVPLPVLELCVT